MLLRNDVASDGLRLSLQQCLLCWRFRQPFKYFCTTESVSEAAPLFGIYYDLTLSSQSQFIGFDSVHVSAACKLLGDVDN